MNIKHITTEELKFLNYVIKESDNAAKQKHFDTIYNTAKRMKTSMQNAHIIYENNKKYANFLNKKLNCNNIYFVDESGAIVRTIRDKDRNLVTKRLSDKYIKEIFDGITINRDKKNDESNLFKNIRINLTDAIMSLIHKF